MSSGHRFQNREQNIFNYLPNETKEYLLPELNEIVSEYTGGVCDKLTNEGKDCLQNTVYKFTAQNNETDINCSSYCIEQIMNWLPKLLITPEEIIIEYDDYEKIIPKKDIFFLKN